MTVFGGSGGDLSPCFAWKSADQLIAERSQSIECVLTTLAGALDRLWMLRPATLRPVTESA